MSLEQQIAGDPENLELIIRAGNLYFDLEEWERAKQWYSRALELDPSNASVLTDLGAAYRYLGQPDAAVLAFNAALSIDPDHWQAVYNKAVTFGYDLDRPEEALKALDSLERMRERIPEIPDLDRLRSALTAGRGEPMPGDKQKDIVRLIEMSGMAETADLILQNLVEQYRDHFPEVPQQLWDEISVALAPEDLVSLFAPIYDRYFTHQDVLELIDFFETPLGQKLIRTQPMITQEALEIGQVWGERKAQEILERLERAGYQPRSST
jgi:tetratricopeptide (TPR) repeat protein